MRTLPRRLAALGGLTVALALPALSPAQAAQTREVVTDADVADQAENTPPTDNWVEYHRNAGDANWVLGPGTPPVGTGSVQLSTPTAADKVQVFNYDHVGTPLSSITDLGYSTYLVQPSATVPQQVVAINLAVDVNGAADGGFTTLVFEPVYNTNQGTVTPGQWQTWDADAGNWWSTRAIPGACAFDCFVSWSAIVAANPDAVVVGGYGVNQGSGNGGVISNADALIFNSTTYDFEVIRDLDGDGIADTAPPTNKDQCKKDGYKSFNNPSFRNQGDCVSYTNGRR